MSPNWCECQTGFRGIACHELVSAVTDSLKYCYRDEDCNGFLLDSDPTFLDPVTFDACCAAGGQGWGLFRNDCMTCMSTEETEANDLISGLDTPVGECRNSTQSKCCILRFQYFSSLVSAIEHTAGLDFRTCYSYGPNYYRTLDGLQYLFPGRCSYIAYEDDEIAIVVALINCNKFSTCRKV